MIVQPVQLKTLDKELAWLDNQSDSMIQLVQELCNQNSGTMNLAGLNRAAEIIVREFSALDGELKTHPSLPMEAIGDDGRVTTQSLGTIIHIVKRPEAKKKVLLCIHYDTVYAVDDSFQSCRWLEPGKLNGPGVADAKGGLIVMLYALRAFEKSQLAQKIGWEVLINPDEEIGSPGSRDFISQIAPRCDFGLLFEPALIDGSLVSWRKGVGNFVFIVRGRSAHAGRDFAAGRNAIVAMSQLMVAVAELNTDPEVTLNVGRVSGGGALNVVPDLAVGRVNVRIKTNEQRAAIVGKLQSLVDKFNQLDGISVEMHGEFTSPPKEVTPEVALLQKRIEASAEVLGVPVRWQGSGGASDGNKFADEGLPNIDSLGPCGGSIHSSDEFLMTDSLVPRARLAALTLLGYAAE